MFLTIFKRASFSRPFILVQTNHHQLKQNYFQFEDITYACKVLSQQKSSWIKYKTKFTKINGALSPCISLRSNHRWKVFEISLLVHPITFKIMEKTTHETIIWHVLPYNPIWVQLISNNPEQFKLFQQAFKEKMSLFEVDESEFLNQCITRPLLTELCKKEISFCVCLINENFGTVTIRNSTRAAAGTKTFRRQRAAATEVFSKPSQLV